MAWTTPTTVNPGDAILSSLWNEQVRDNLANLRALANVQQTVYTGTTSTSSTGFTDVGTLSVSITPTFNTSKVLVSVKIDVESAAAQGFFQLIRGATVIGVGAAAGSRTPTSMRSNPSAFDTISMVFLDSPATTSATTYKVQYRSNVSGQTIYINRQSGDGDTSSVHRGISTITVQEIPV